MELKVTEIYHDGKAEITRIFHDVTELKEVETHSGSIEPLHEYYSYWYEVFKKSIKIVDMYSGGYENYYYEIVFTIPDSDTKFTFTIPNPNVMNVENFEYAFQGKLAFGYYNKEEHCHYIETSSYRVEDITKAFEEFINKEDK